MITFLSFGFILILTEVFPIGHKFLRLKHNFNQIFITSLIISILCICLYYFTENGKTEKLNMWSPLSVVIFLLLYKLFDNIILKIYNRNLFFFIEHNRNTFDDEESEKSSFLDIVFQFLLLIIPIGAIIVLIKFV